jgi:enoyl-CoA hydratase/carnithine racemase
VGLTELSAALEAELPAAEAGEIRALLLRGEGKAFCAGRDISAVDPATDDVPGYLDGLTVPAMRALHSFPAPSFAAVHGACLGVGLGLAMACDVVYVGESARIGSPFAGLGAALDSGGHWLLTQRLGTHKALDLIYTGELMTGTESVSAGLFSRSVPDDALLGFARERATRVADGATGALLASRRLVFQVRDGLGFEDSLEAESALQESLRTTDDYAEGFAAFQQKRGPVFKH